MEPGDLAAWLASNGHALTGGGLWALGGEPNVQAPDEFDRRRVRALVVRLSTYRDVAASTSHGAVAAILRNAGDVYCDLAFLPPAADRRRLRAAGLPLLFGTTSRRAARSFDVVAFSASFAGEFLNIPNLLRGSGIPLARADRLADPRAPLVVLGGAASSHTSVLNGDAAPGKGGLVDAVLVGEAEALASPLVRLLEESRAHGWDKGKLLEAAAGAVPGFYDPSRYRQSFGGAPSRLVSVEPVDGRAPFPVRRAAIGDPDGTPEPAAIPIPFDLDGIGTARIRISFGCPYTCTFCQEGWDQKPYRERSIESLGDMFRAAKARQGADAVDLYSFNFNMHSQIHPIMEEAAAVFDRVTLRSQRIDLLGRDPELWRIERLLGKRIVTVGIEGISERLRRRLGKAMGAGDIVRGFEVLLANPPGECKIFLIGTGEEEDEDYQEFERFARFLSGRAGMTPTRFVLSLTPLIATPHTPSAFRGSGAAAEAFGEFAERIGRIARRNGFESRVAAEASETLAMQLLLLGDRRVTPALARAQADGEHLYDGSVPAEAGRLLLAELHRDGLGPENFLHRRAARDPFPWDDIAAGARREFLEEAFRAAEAGRDPPACFDSEGKGDTGEGAVCRACGACRTPDEVRAVTRRTLARRIRPGAIEAALEGKRSPDRLFVKLDVAATHRRVPDRFWSVAAARALMLASPALVAGYLSPDPAPEPSIPNAAGDRWLSLRFRRGTLPAIASIPLDEANRELGGARIARIAVEAPGPQAELACAIEAPRIAARDLCRGIQSPAAGRTLPLTLTRRGGGYSLDPSGKNAAKCPVRSALVEERGDGSRADIRIRASFDLDAAIRTAACDDPDRYGTTCVRISLSDEI